jgi:hypothetical protein
LRASPVGLLMAIAGSFKNNVVQRFGGRAGSARSDLAGTFHSNGSY